MSSTLISSLKIIDSDRVLQVCPDLPPLKVKRNPFSAFAFFLTNRLTADNSILTADSTVHTADALLL